MQSLERSGTLDRSRTRISGILIGLVIAVAVAACATDAQSGGTAANGGDTITFATPVGGAQVTVPFDVQLESSVSLGAPDTGIHHAHLYFDTTTDSADYDIVYGNSWRVERNLAPGEHTITVALANADHSLAGPTQTITVTVGGGSSAGGSSEPAATSAVPGY
jgi:hypothetical protein